jgi:hypothetical protein
VCTIADGRPGAVSIGTFISVFLELSDIEVEKWGVELSAVVLGSKAAAMRSEGKNSRNASRVFISIALPARTRSVPNLCCGDYRSNDFHE